MEKQGYVQAVLRVLAIHCHSGILNRVKIFALFFRILIQPCRHPSKKLYSRIDDAFSKACFFEIEIQKSKKPT
ncbi:hypothetical protein AAKU67_001823 [Oxalobacteraceae bacterium GrIS 2.11]